MPKSKRFSALIDYAHGEILNFSDIEFKPFVELLRRSGCSFTYNRTGKIGDEKLDGIDLIIIGCPVNHYFISEEIKVIVDFVMAGGCLLVVNEYGGDSVQKTNLNELTKYFGIYFEGTTIRTEKFHDTGSSSLPMITDMAQHEINKNVRKIILGGCCSIRVASEAFGLFFSGRDTWIDIYDDLNNLWIKSKEINVPLIAASVYGQGRVVALGDIDIFSSNPRFGLDSLDNKRLIQNVIDWLNQPVQSAITIDWILSQVSVHREDILKNIENFNNLVETVKILEKRISNLENMQDKIQDQLFTQSQIIYEKFASESSTDDDIFDQENEVTFDNSDLLDDELKEISDENLKDL
jgi:hypothetical protein